MKRPRHLLRGNRPGRVRGQHGRRGLLGELGERREHRRQRSGETTQHAITSQGHRTATPRPADGAMPLSGLSAGPCRRRNSCAALLILHVRHLLRNRARGRPLSRTPARRADVVSNAASVSGAPARSVALTVRVRTCGPAVLSAGSKPATWCDPPGMLRRGRTRRRMCQSDELCPFSARLQLQAPRPW